MRKTSYHRGVTIRIAGRKFEKIDFSCDDTNMTFEEQKAWVHDQINAKIRELMIWSGKFIPSV